jgi:hypothetical protein
LVEYKLVPKAIGKSTSDGRRYMAIGVSRVINYIPHHVTARRQFIVAHYSVEVDRRTAILVSANRICTVLSLSGRLYTVRYLILIFIAVLRDGVPGVRPKYAAIYRQSRIYCTVQYVLCCILLISTSGFLYIK